MKIAITGAHRTGKTSLAEILKESLPAYELYAEPYYELEEAGYIFSEIPDADDFIKQFEHSVKQVSESFDSAIFDRCPLDVLAYVHALDETRDISSHFEEALESLTGIDLLVFVPIEKPDIIPVNKSDLTELRTKVDDILHEWISELDIKTIIVQGSLQQRRDQVLASKYFFPMK